MEECKDACARNRRKSRKHQRFLLRKEFLQHHRIVNKNEAECFGEAISKDNKPIHISSQSCFSGDDSSGNICLDKQSVKLDEIKVILGTMPPLTACSSANHIACDYDSGLSVSSCSPSSRPSSPEPWLKPGKCVAIDCEMVGTGPGGRISELARCSVVSYCGDVVYDQYINPVLPVTDYRTRWSGITRRHMKKAISFKKAQKEILNLLKDKRVIGHDVKNDFKVLKYFHPDEQIRDTSKIALLNQLAGLPTRSKVSLKKLAWSILHKKIQVGDKGHSSVEDAKTCMELYKLVEEQVEQALLNGFPESIYINPAVHVAPDNSQYLEDQYWPPDLNEGSEFLNFN